MPGTKKYNFEDLLERKPIVLDVYSISQQLKDKTILITGAAGSIGAEIVKQVICFKPKAIVLLDQAETPLYLLGLEVELLAQGIELYIELADITYKNSVNSIFAKYKPDVVYHAAAYKHLQMLEQNPAQAVFVNIEGTRIVANLAAKHSVGTFVMISTDKAVRPSSIMGASKLIAEKYINALQQKLLGGHTKYIITRFGNVLGSNGSVVPLFEKQIHSGGPVTVTHPDVTRYFMTVKEACQLVLEAGAMGKGGEIYMFDMGNQVRIADMANKMIALAGYTPGTDIKIKYIGLRPGEKLYEDIVTQTAKMLSTHNKDIMIGAEEPEEYSTFSIALDGLYGVAVELDNDAVVAKMKEIIPEFVSQVN